MPPLTGLGLLCGEASSKALPWQPECLPLFEARDVVAYPVPAEFLSQSGGFLAACECLPIGLKRRIWHSSGKHRTWQASSTETTTSDMRTWAYGRIRGGSKSSLKAADFVNSTSASRRLGKVQSEPEHRRGVTKQVLRSVGKHPLPIPPSRDRFALDLLCKVNLFLALGARPEQARACSHYVVHRR